MSFTEVYVSRRKLQSEFFTQINKCLDWNAIDMQIKKHYNKGASVAAGHLILVCCCLKCACCKHGMD